VSRSIRDDVRAASLLRGQGDGHGPTRSRTLSTTEVFLASVEEPLDGGLPGEATVIIAVTG